MFISHNVFTLIDCSILIVSYLSRALKGFSLVHFFVSVSRTLKISLVWLFRLCLAHSKDSLLFEYVASILYTLKIFS